MSLYSVTAVSVLFSSCASIGNPSGGPRDEDPPRFVHSTPLPYSTNFQGSKLTIDFDEIVNVKDAFSKVVLSPPAKSTPRVSSLGKRVTVEFKDTLLPNTTYTIDFADAIADNNEGNVLENFTFAFSTGDAIDSLCVSGMVLGAADLEPMQGMVVGLYTNPADSMFRTRPFERIAKTDQYGRFFISGLAPGQYRIYALEDKDNNLFYSSPEEGIAFTDAIISPTATRTVTCDTIYNLKTGAVDTIVERERSLFLPNDILLRSFTSALKQQFVTKYERPDSTRISLIFNSPARQTPEFSIVGAPKMKNWAVTERSATNDTITLWLSDRSLIKADTLRLAVRYQRELPGLITEEVNDTLRLISPKAKQAAKKKPKKQNDKTADSSLPDSIPIPTITWRASGGLLEINNPLILETPTPLARIDTTMIHLEVKSDTIWTPYPLKGITLIDSINPSRYKIDFKPDFKSNYRLTIDSLAATDIYGVNTNKLSVEYSTRDSREYSSIRFNLTNYTDSVPLFMQLISPSDAPLRTERVTDGKVIFNHITAGKYYARLIADFNDNLKIDAGDYDRGTAPDLVYYYPKIINLKQNWRQEIDWNVFGTPVNKMKPLPLLKNKPAGMQNLPTNATEGNDEEDM